jgi:hypothetical protein
VICWGTATLDRRFVLILKDSSGGLMEKGGSVAWTEPPRDMDMDVVDGILTQGD